MKHLLAAFIFFTRLPFWRISEVPAEYYRRVVDFWPIIGLFTGTTSALVLWGCAHILPPITALIIAMLWRLLITGALHEDGLADFFDGFGGGGTRERILSIMKDSHIGTYGVLSLIFYYLILFSVLSTMPVDIMCLTLIAGDVFGKFCGAQLINSLPYARKAEDAKNKIIYDRISVTAIIGGIVVVGLTASLLPIYMLWAYLIPPIVLIILIDIMRRRIGGYTGDCCGATFLMCELSFYIAAAITQRI